MTAIMLFGSAIPADGVPVTPTPEPMTIFLSLSALAGLFLMRRRNAAKA
jgi:hypothetical protein